jgi:hypothetical protein
LRHWGSVFEQDEGGDASNAVLGWCRLVAIDIEPDNRELIVILGGDFLQDRLVHLARPRPFRPEIHEHWPISP